MTHTVTVSLSQAAAVWLWLKSWSTRWHVARTSTLRSWVPEEWAYVLRKAGFNLISDIRDEKPQGLQQKIGEINKKYKLGYEKPSVDEIQQWIEKSNV